MASKRYFADRYHGKVVPTDAAEDLVTLDAPIELRFLGELLNLLVPHLGEG